MNKVIFGILLVVSGLIGTVGLIVGILISLGSYAGYYGDMLFYGFIRRFSLQPLFIIFVTLWVIGMVIVGKESFKKVK